MFLCNLWYVSMFLCVYVTYLCFCVSMLCIYVSIKSMIGKFVVLLWANVYCELAIALTCHINYCMLACYILYVMYLCFCVSMLCIYVSIKSMIGKFVVLLWANVYCELAIALTCHINYCMLACYILYVMYLCFCVSMSCIYVSM